MRIFYALAVMTLFLSSSLFAQTSIRQDHEEIRGRMLTHLYLLETNYMMARSYRMKHYEVIYNPLWQAMIKTRDLFSPAVRQNGEMLRSRYEESADTYESLAFSAEGKIQNNMRSLAKEIQSVKVACKSKAYEYCVDSWAHTAIVNLRTMAKSLKLILRTGQEMSVRVAESLEDNPSEHDPFPQRYKDFFNQILYRDEPSLLIAMREFREEVELRWPNECQSKCSGADAVISDDPVLNTIKPDPTGEHGVDGNIVHQDDFGKAIDEAVNRK